MAVFKCKMCGGDLVVNENVKVVECDYCGTNQTIPSTDNEKKINLFNRANRLRSSNEFDKAAGVYESIVAEFPKEAEAYWGLCLCKYGIEYVDDAATAKKIPTCHRTAYESIFSDNNYKMALENADAVAIDIYKSEAQEIDRIQKNILSIVNKEEPFDIFICYKETSEDGQRTKDSVLAQNIYDALTEKGYKVFFARITLEDKLGQEYEPYIFAALNSAKVMLAVGTKYEYYHAVWVKNEWSRFLDLMKSDSKKTLIPCYTDIDAYDMPEEFKNLQGQDMGKIGFIQDLVRGIGKIIPREQELGRPAQQVVVQQVEKSNADNLLKRGYMALQEKQWNDASKFFERVLDENAQNAHAYLGKLLGEYQCDRKEKLQELWFQEFENSTNYKNAIACADEELKEQLKAYSEKAHSIESLLEQGFKVLQMEEWENARSYFDAVLRKNSKNIEAYRGKLLARLELANENQGVGNLNVIENIQNTEEYKKMMLHAEEDLKESMRLLFCKILYNCVERRLNNLKDVASGENFKEYKIARSVYELIVDYEESQKNIKMCDEHMKNIMEKQRKKIIPSKNKKIATIPTISLKITSDGKISFVNAAYIRNIGGFQSWDNLVSIDENNGVFVMGLRSDGTVVAVERIDDTPSQYKAYYGVSGWSGIKEISAGSYHMVGLRSDGTVVAAGQNIYGECDVDDWKDIVAIRAGECYTVGLRSDGTVVVAGFDYAKERCSKWENIVAIETTRYSRDVTLYWRYMREKDKYWRDIFVDRDFFGVCADGSIVTMSEGKKTGPVGNIVSIATSRHMELFILKEDGKVVRRGLSFKSDAVGGIAGDEVEQWTNIVSLACGNKHVVGLCADGTVVAAGENKDGQCNVTDWHNVVEIAVGGSYTIGVCSDGKVLMTGFLHQPKEVDASENNGANNNISQNAGNGGCYVATCVYGSYDCPQVWTLRRFRDDILAPTWFGQKFIETYYAISPTLVKWFGETKWFKLMWRKPLDYLVKKLQDKGVECTPYQDNKQ